MNVAICIVGFRNAEEIATCVLALAASTYDRFDVVICENGGPEAHSALVAAVPSILRGGQTVECLLAPGNLGYAGGVNLAIRARPDAAAWWVVNPDTVPEPEALAAFMARLARGDCDAVSGTLYHPDGRVQADGGRWRGWLARPESMGMGRQVDTRPDVAAIERKMNYIVGASMLISRRFVDVTGLMQEDYFLYCEEIEWCLRGIAKGMKLGFTPEAKVKHGQGGTTGSADPIRLRPRLPIYLDERNKLHVVRDTTPLRWPVAVVAALALLTLRYARQRAWAQWGYALSGWWAGVRGLRGLPPWMR